MPDVPYSGVTMTIGTYPVISADRFYKECLRVGWPTDWASKANCFTNQNGSKPGRGWFLMRGADVVPAFSDAFGPNCLSGATLKCHTAGIGGKEFEISGLYLVRSDRIGNGFQTEDNCLHLVEVADARALFEGQRSPLGKDARSNPLRWPYAVTGNTAFDVSGVAPSGAYTTWSGFIEALWYGMGLGDFPGLPSEVSRSYEPVGNVSFSSRYALECIEEALNHCGCTLCLPMVSPRTPTTGSIPGSKFTIVKMGGTQAYDGSPPQEFAIKDVQKNLGGPACFPSTITVMFRKFSASMGGGLLLDPTYLAVSVDSTTGGGADLNGARELVVYDNLQALYVGSIEYDDSGFYPLAGPTPDPMINRDAIIQRALEVATETFKSMRYESGTAGQRFSGLHPAFTSGTIPVVRWGEMAGIGAFTETSTQLPVAASRETPPPNDVYCRMVWVQMIQNLPRLTIQVGDCWTPPTEVKSTGRVIPMGSDSIYPSYIADNAIVDVSPMYLVGQLFGEQNYDGTNPDDNRGDRALCLVVPADRDSVLYAVSGGKNYITGTVLSVATGTDPKDGGKKYSVVSVDFAQSCTDADTRQIKIYSWNTYGDPTVGDKVGCLWNQAYRHWETALERCS